MGITFKVVSQHLVWLAGLENCLVNVTICPCIVIMVDKVMELVVLKRSIE